MLDAISMQLPIVPIRCHQHNLRARKLLETVYEADHVWGAIGFVNAKQSACIIELHECTHDKYENYIQVVPGRAGGGSFKRKKNYIAKKEFAYRMCAR